jgi:hypothetical protein
MSRIDGDVELPLVFGLQKANYAVVLELLSHGTHEDGAQLHLRRDITLWLSVRRRKRADGKADNAESYG